MWEAFKLKFSLDVVVTIVFWANFMYEQTQTIAREAVSWKFYSKSKKQFGKHYLDRGSVHASEIGWAHGKIQHKLVHFKSGHIL